MDVPTLKLLLTPALIGAASVAGRRWGPVVSGWLVGLPLTSGPIAFFLALDHGVAFARAAAVATLAGATSQALFCLAYAWLAPRLGWAPTLAASALAFGASTLVLHYVTGSLVPVFATVLVVLLAALGLMPRRSGAPASARTPPRWDIPARMVVALTGLAPILGPRPTGLLAPFPLYAAILAAFAHRLEGACPATNVLTGLLLGLFAFAGFFVVLATLIERAGIAVAFAAALVAALAFQGVSLGWLRSMPARSFPGSDRAFQPPVESGP